VGNWRRPYRTGAGRWMVALWEAGALILLHRTTVDLYHLTSSSRLLIALAFAIMWVALCIRLTRLGLFVAPGGIQIRGLVTRRTIRWHEVERIVVDRAHHQWLGLRIPSGRTAIIELHNGERVNSSLWADGIDFKFSPAGFRQACADLRREHASATPNEVTKTAPSSDA
jgi:hypothetical protein